VNRHQLRFVLLHAERGERGNEQAFHAARVSAALMTYSMIWSARSSTDCGIVRLRPVARHAGVRARLAVKAQIAGRICPASDAA